MILHHSALVDFCKSKHLKISAQNKNLIRQEFFFKKCQPNLQACMHKEGAFPSCRTFAICNLSLVAIFGAAFLKDVKN